MIVNDYSTRVSVCFAVINVVIQEGSTRIEKSNYCFGKLVGKLFQKRCGIQLLWKYLVLILAFLSRPYPFKFFKGYLPENLLSPLLNTLSSLEGSYLWNICDGGFFCDTNLRFWRFHLDGQKRVLGRPRTSSHTEHIRWLLLHLLYSPIYFSIKLFFFLSSFYSWKNYLFCYKKIGLIAVQALCEKK